MKNCLRGRFDVTEMINHWLYSPQHYPVIKVTKTNESAMISVKNYSTWEEKLPWIPVTKITWQLNSEIDQNSDVIWLKPTHKGIKPYAELVLDFNFHWIIINVEQAGNIFNKIYYIYIYFSKYFLFI